MRIYYATFTGIAVTAQQDFFEIATPTQTGVQLISFSITQSSSTTSEMLQVLVKRGQTTTGSGGATITPSLRQPNGSAAASTVKRNNTTKASAGTIVTVRAEAFNVLSGLNVIWLPEDRPTVEPSSRCTVELATTPAASLTMSGTLTFTEVS